MKVYKLTDGTTGTVEDFCSRVPGVSLNAMRKRLNTTRDPSRIFMSPEEALRHTPWRSRLRLQLPNTPPPLEK